MNSARNRHFLVALLLVIWAPAYAHADIDSDLDQIRKQISSGQLQSAVQQLKQLSQDNPRHIPSLLALAECQLKLGNPTAALARYKQILTLSPQHGLAKAVVESLETNQKDTGQAIQQIRSLAAIGQHSLAYQLAKTRLKAGLSRDDREALQIAAAEVGFHSGEAATLDLIRWAHELGTSAKGGSIYTYAALHLALSGDQRGFSSFVEKAPKLEDENATRLKLARFLHESHKEWGGGKELRSLLDVLPQSKIRGSIENLLYKQLAAQISRWINLGSLNQATSELWLAISSKPLPELGQKGQLALAGNGWASKDSAGQIASLLIQVSQKHRESKDASAAQRALWLAFELTRQSERNATATSQLLTIAALFGQWSKADLRRTAGFVDEWHELEWRAISEVGTRELTKANRSEWVKRINEHLHRYSIAGRPDAALAQTVEPQGRLVPALRQHLSQTIYLKLIQLAHSAQKRAWSKAGNVQAAAIQLTKIDRAVLFLVTDHDRYYAPNKETTQIFNTLMQRLISKARWDLVQEAIAIRYRHLETYEHRWLVIDWKVRELAAIETAQVAHRKRLPAEPFPQLDALLKEALGIYNQSKSDVDRRQLIAVASGLIQRYNQINQRAWIGKVISTLSPAANSPLADWALIERAGLQRRQAIEALEILNQTEAEIVAILAGHKAELGLLTEILKSHAKSDYVESAITRIQALARFYGSKKRWSLAEQIYQQAMTTAPAFAERLGLKSVELRFEAAHIALNQLKSKPTAISDEYKAAFNGLADYVQKHPLDERRATVETMLMNVVIAYGRRDAWNVVRTILAELQKQLPDYYDPGRIEFLVAVTYLGELNNSYAMRHLLPPQPPTAPQVAAADPAASPQPSRPTAQAMAGMAGMGAPGGSGAPGRGSGGGGFGGAAGGMMFGGDGGSMPGNLRADFADATLQRYGRIQANQSGGQQGQAQSSAPQSNMGNNPQLTRNVRQARQRDLQQIAMLEEQQRRPAQAAVIDQEGSARVALPSGRILSDREIKRQDAAANEAYKRLLVIHGKRNRSESARARSSLIWLISHFEATQRRLRAVEYTRQLLKDIPKFPKPQDLEFRIITNLLAHAERATTKTSPDLQWLEQRHQEFETARTTLQQFIQKYKEKQKWSDGAISAFVDSFRREAILASRVSPTRFGGLMVQHAQQLIALRTDHPKHVQVKQIPDLLWRTTDTLINAVQTEQAVFVLDQIPINYPVHALSQRSLLRIAELRAANLAQPLKAVEAYLEYLSVVPNDQKIANAIFQIGQQLYQKQRYLEAVHAYQAFVDSFPSHAQAAQALYAIGQTHQQNEAWDEALESYGRIIDEFPNNKLLPQVRLGLADAHIQLSQWQEARRQYQEFVKKHPKDGNAALANARLPILKSLDRYQQLLADKNIQRNKDDAQFQIARISLQQLNNPVKAVAEYRKVVAEYPNSDVADDAQFELGKVLLQLKRLDEARAALLQVPVRFPNSPVADDALYAVGQSFEQQAQQFASVTSASALQMAIARNQQSAFQKYNDRLGKEVQRQRERRAQLKQSGKKDQLDLDEASNAFRLNGIAQGELVNTARGAELKAETESALQVASRQDRINEAYREAIAMYMKAAGDYPLGDTTDQALLRVAQIFETKLRDRKAAMDTYQRIVKLFPGTPVAEDAAWNVALFYEQEAKHQMASDAFREFIRNYPGSRRVADAQFAFAESLEQMDKWVEAMDAYEVFRQKFAKHPKARLASEQINWIKTYRK